jgi:hypothetical protein
MARPVRDKLDWAERHLVLLNREVARFTKREPYRIVRKGSPQEGRIEWRIAEIRRQPDVILWGLIVGDCVHALRSRLDHVAWKLAGSRGDDTTTQFPLFTKRERFKQHGAWRIEDVPKQARTLMKCVQPYRRGQPDSDFLAVLAELDNLDKHRTIPVVVSALREGTFHASRSKNAAPAPTGPSGLGRHHWTWHTNAITEPAPIASFEFDPPDPHAKVKADFRFGIFFDESLPVIGKVEVTDLLGKLIERVRIVTAMFDRFG